MSNSTEQIPSGATHRTPKGTYMKHAAGAWFEWLHEWVKVDSGVHVKVNQLTEISGDEMNPKKLTQAVFDNLSPEYRWAAVDASGVAFAFNEKPRLGDIVWAGVTNSDYRKVGDAFGVVDWQNSLIERQDVPTADIDWSRQDVPAGAMYFMRHPTALSFYRGGDDGWEGYHSKKREWYMLKNTGEFFYKNLLEIPTKPEPQVDWSKAPEGATHYSPETDATHECFYKDDFKQMWIVKMPRIGWQDASPVSEHERIIEIPQKTESINEIARSIEAARVAEKSGNRCATCTANICSVIDDCYVRRAKEESARMPWPDGDPRYFETSDVPETKKYPHYFKDVSAVDAIDLYHVARLYGITDPALFHAFKKIACAGKRGAKDQTQDVQEAIDALKRWQELNV